MSIKKIPVFLVLLFLISCGGQGKKTKTVKSDFIACHGCRKYGVDPDALAQLNVRAKNRSTITRGSNIYPGCQSVDSEFVCFVSGKNLFCGSKRVLGVFLTDNTFFCNDYKIDK